MKDTVVIIKYSDIITGLSSLFVSRGTIAGGFALTFVNMVLDLLRVGINRGIAAL